MVPSVYCTCAPEHPRATARVANDYRISVAVAGFTEADLAIEAKENTLTLRGEKQTNDEQKSGDVLYQGIAARNFERSFQLADHVQVKGASLQNGGTNLLRGGRRMHLASGPPPVT